MKNKESHPLSFWQFLEQYQIIIPIIQRDFAQGRIDKHELRKEFYGQLISALKENTPIKLDYVFGTPGEIISTEDNASKIPPIYPIDGQQRLTSLWLMHWYIAYRCGNKLSDGSITNVLRKFRYQTRQTSREFCSNLCKPLLGKDDKNITDLIRKQPWFSQRFKEDPTVSAMMRSLSDADTHSGFVELLDQEKDLNPQLLWDRLTDEVNCPIKFFFQNAGEFNVGNPDDLYIKMNARGKKLTEFENFKAALFSYKKDNKYVFRENGDDFIKIFENDWSNIFWRYRKKNSFYYDDLMFEFFNRVAFNFLLINYSDFREEGLRLSLEYFKPDTRSEYQSIKVYEPILKLAEFKTAFYSLMRNLIDFYHHGIDIMRQLENKPYSFDFFFYYDESKGSDVFTKTVKGEELFVPKPTVKSQALFYAAIIYIINCKSAEDFQEKHFDDWMMFARNLFLNSGIDSFEGLRSYFLFIDPFARYSLNIIEHLSSSEFPQKNNSHLDSQLSEEIAKTHKINEFRSCGISSSLETDIRTAESYPDFDGCIRFLFTDNDGNIDWSDFSSKEKTFKKIVTYSKLSETNVDNRYNAEVSPDVLRTLLSYIDIFDDLKHISFSSRRKQLKEIFLNEKFYNPVHLLLVNGILPAENLNLFESPITEPIIKDVHEDLVRSRILYQTTWGEAKNPFKLDTNLLTLYQYRCSRDDKYYLLGSARNRLIKEGELAPDGQKLSWIGESRFLYDREHLWGLNFLFNFEWNKSGYVFYWYRTQHYRESDEKDIYLCRDDEGYPYVDKDCPEKLGIAINLTISYEQFIEKLRELIDKGKRYDKDKIAN